MAAIGSLLPSASCASYEARVACRSSRSLSSASPGVFNFHASTLRLRKWSAASDVSRKQQSCPTILCSQNFGRDVQNHGAISQLKEVLFRVLASGVIGLSVIAPISGEALLAGPHVVAYAAEETFLERAPAAAASAVKLTAEERVQQLKDTLAQIRRETQEAADKAEAEGQAALAKNPLLEAEQKRKSNLNAPVAEKSVTSPAVVAKKTRTHGYMPLFLAQFLLLSAVAGISVTIVKVPESSWSKGQEKVNELVADVTPKVEAAWSKAEPIVIKAWDAIKNFAVLSRPYVDKAVAQAQPVVLKAVESAKPVVKQGQEKVSELLAQVQAKAKSS